MGKIANPNKHKKKQAKKKKKRKKSIIKQNEKNNDNDNNMDFGNDGWGNDFSFDTTTESNETKQNGVTSPPQPIQPVTTEKTTQNATQQGDDWDAFGNFFDDE